MSNTDQLIIVAIAAGAALLVPLLASPLVFVLVLALLTWVNDYPDIKED